MYSIHLLSEPFYISRMFIEKLDLENVFRFFNTLLLRKIGVNFYVVDRNLTILCFRHIVGAKIITRDISPHLP
jgi:hypothetical protein